MDPSLMKTNMNRLAVSNALSGLEAGAIGAAVAEKITNHPEAVRDLFERFSPIVGSAAGNLNGLAPQGFVSRPSFMRRLEELSSTYFQSPESQPVGPAAPSAEAVAKLIQDAIGNLQAPLQNKLGAMDTALPMKRKKKKKGLGGKLKKGLKKIKSKVSKTVKGAMKAGKGIFARAGKGLFKGVIGKVKGLFNGKMLKGLGGIFKMGSGLMGGLLGGPIGSRMLGQITGKKAAGLSQIFGQVNRMFQVVNKIRKDTGNMLSGGLMHGMRV